MTREEARTLLAIALLEWRDAGGDIVAVVRAIEQLAFIASGGVVKP